MRTHTGDRVLYLVHKKLKDSSNKQYSITDRCREMRVLMLLMMMVMMLMQGEGAFPVISKALQYGGNLTIPHLTKDDQGSYECVASNPVTNVITSALLIIECTLLSVNRSLLLTRLHIVYSGARLVTIAGVCRRLSSVGVCNTRICNVTHQGAARGGPVVLRPVRATPCSPIINQAAPVVIFSQMTNFEYSYLFPWFYPILPNPISPNPVSPDPNSPNPNSRKPV